MSATKINVNGVEFELNLLDADVVEKYEHLNKEITRKIQDTKAYEGKTTAEGMRYQCRCVEEYFDKLFGNGTSAKIFPKNNDLGIRMDAYGYVASLTADKQITDITNKYSSQRTQNRAQRRAAKKNKNKFHAANR